MGRTLLHDLVQRRFAHDQRHAPDPAAAQPRRSGERAVVPDAEFTSYYGRPVLNPPRWQARDIAGYLFLGGLAGASSVLGAGAQVTGRPGLARSAKVTALGAIGLSAVALVHDLGRPERFLNMLRVVKPTSPMSMGSWLLSAYGPAAGVAAATAVTGRLPKVGAAATAGAALLGPAVAAYTAALFADTAVPAWHDAHRELPYVFVGSAATAAGGFALVTAPSDEQAPARALAAIGVVTELGAFELMQRRMGLTAEPYRSGPGGRWIRASQVLAVGGAAGALLGRGRVASALSGAALVAASACTRWGIFHGGVESVRDPRYTVVPQRTRASRTTLR
ncbi:NrfD/PsrC family molybdoenzyme membrane anchor subunit [Pseudonocardia sp. CA-107938]|uniref:NrfD/PsrC family molybdoenzyme membrane anchor subunit n=1 Tax=Pseudonocardia sp. CA-107938 TaxID=3240021 RepID=UPI003D945F6E